MFTVYNMNKLVDWSNQREKIFLLWTRVPRDKISIFKSHWLCWSNLWMVKQIIQPRGLLVDKVKLCNEPVLKVSCTILIKQWLQSSKLQFSLFSIAWKQIYSRHELNLLKRFKTECMHSREQQKKEDQIIKE